MPNNRISALRHEYGMNQKELGDRLGVGQTTVSAWETGKNEPDNETLHKMAQLFRCSIGYLTGYENDERTRGLTDAERRRYWEQEQEERWAKEAQQLENISADEDFAESIARQEWQNTCPNIFFEVFLIQQICENLPQSMRKHLADTAMSLKRALNAEQ